MVSTQARARTATLEEISAVVRGVLASIDPLSMGGREVRALLELFAGLAKLGQAGVVLLAGRVEATGAWKGSGASSAAGFVGGALGSSVSDGGRAIDTSSRLLDQPRLAEALGHGKVSLGQAAEISTTVDTLAAAGQEDAASAAEADLVALSSEASLATLRTEGQRRRAAARDELAQRRHWHRTRAARRRSFDDGGQGLDVKLPPETAAMLYAVVDGHVDDLFRHPGPDGPPTEGRDAVMADALCDLLGVPRSMSPDAPVVPGAPGASLGGRGAPDAPVAPDGGAADRVGEDAGSAGGSSPGGGVKVKGREIARRLVVRIDFAALMRGSVEPGEMCEIPGVGPVPVAVARDVLGSELCDIVIHHGTDIRTVVCGSRSATLALRRAVLERDGYVCVDCRSPFGLELDHFQPASITNHTIYDEYGPRCRRCHKQKSQREAATTRAAGIARRRSPHPQDATRATPRAGPRAAPVGRGP